jgi:phosphate transport system substrate-binding protein
MRLERLSRLLGIAAVIALVACGGVSSSTPTPAASADVGSGQLLGAGATFPEPFYTKAFFAYNQKYSQVSVNYQPIGSGGGITQFTKNTVDFGASDVPMNSTEIQAAGGEDSLLQLPATIGVVAIAYNLPDVNKLQLDGATLANIFLGSIKKWNDPAIAALNSGAKLPSADIAVIHRSDGSGTTFAFTDYLSKVSPDWQTKVGKSKSVQWPTGVGASGNQGVGQQVKTTDGSIGYVELAYVIQSKLQHAFLKNKAGKFLQASLEGATAASASLTGLSPTNFSITEAPGDKTYPISTYSWVMLRKEQSDATKGKAVVKLWQWVVTDGQQYGKDLEYASLPKEAQDFALGQLKKITSSGKPILS